MGEAALPIRLLSSVTLTFVEVLKINIPPIISSGKLSVVENFKKQFLSCTEKNIQRVTLLRSTTHLKIMTGPEAASNLGGLLVWIFQKKTTT